MRVNEFLELYRSVEDSLEIKYSGKKRRYNSVVFEYINDEESKPIRDNLDTCREIRNLLTHNAKIGGENIIEPSRALCDSLRNILDFINKPSLALDVATKSGQILRANPEQFALKIMKIMERNGFSHVPIMENGNVSGVFSLGAVFSYILHNDKHSILDDTTIGDLYDHLPIEKHIENYKFASKTLTCFDARRIFEQVNGKNKRISVIFITANGNKNEKLLGMITPWDVLGEENS